MKKYVKPTVDMTDIDPFEVVAASPHLEYTEQSILPRMEVLKGSMREIWDEDVY